MRINQLFKCGIVNSNQTYIPSGFIFTGENKDYIYHESLPYALYKWGAFGVIEVKPGRLVGYAEMIPPSRPTRREGRAREKMERAKEDAIELAIDLKVLLYLTLPSSLNKRVKVIQANPYAADLFFVGSTITVMEEFEIDGNLIFRGRGQTGVEFYIPAACTDYLPPTTNPQLERTK